jgi:hypothetical protein
MARVICYGGAHDGSQPGWRAWPGLMMVIVVPHAWHCRGQGQAEVAAVAGLAVAGLAGPQPRHGGAQVPAEGLLGAGPVPVLLAPGFPRGEQVIDPYFAAAAAFVADERADR